MVLLLTALAAILAVPITLFIVSDSAILAFVVIVLIAPLVLAAAKIAVEGSAQRRQK